MTRSPVRLEKKALRKEVNALARKAGKKKSLNLIAAALKRKQAKEAKKSPARAKPQESIPLVLMALSLST